MLQNNLSGLTNNESFIKVANDLKSKNVNNHSFMLQTLNERLIEIDPWNDKIVKDYIDDVMEECKNNFWYFAREIVRIQLDDDRVPFKLDAGNLAMLYASLNGISSWRTNIRQCGSSTSIQIYLLWRMMFNENDKIALAMPHQHAVRESLIDMINRIKLPSYLRNAYELIWRGNALIMNNSSNNEIVGIPRVTSMVHAASYARGMVKYKTLILDEAEHIKYWDELINYIRLFTDDTSTPVFIFNSTFASEDIVDTIKIDNYISRMMKWYYEYYDTPINELKDNVNNHEVKCIYIYHDYKELGYTDDWYKEMELVMNNPDATKRECYPLRTYDHMNVIERRLKKLLKLCNDGKHVWRYYNDNDIVDPLTFEKTGRVTMKYHFAQATQKRSCLICGKTETLSNQWI